MSFLQSLLSILDTSMPKPGMYGWFHILCLLLTVGITALLCRHLRQPDDRARRLVLITAIIVSILEIYKQINYTFSYDGGISADFAWYAFPFQFCSTPMYAGLVAGLTRRGKLHEATCAYLASYALFAGLSVMLYPATVFIDTVGINIQTMVCHGSMITVGVCLLASGYVKLDHRTVLKALPVFLFFVAAAVCMNEHAYRTGLLETDTFNMFFISPYCEPSLPVYSLVQGVVPFPWCLVLYILGFTAAAYLVLLLAMGIRALAARNHTAPAHIS